MSIGRAADNTLTLDDPAVSRRHARIEYHHGAPHILDLGSRYGTWVDGVRIERPVPLGDGSEIRLGDQVLVVRRVRSADQSAATIIVADIPRPDAAAGQRSQIQSADQPRLRPGYSLKRLSATEGARRYVLKDHRNGKFVRLAGEDATLLELLDGSHSLEELVSAAETRGGDGGGARMVRLVADLADRGMLDGVAAAGTAPAAGRGLLRPREWTWSGAPDWFERVYGGPGRLLVSQPAVLLAAALALAGLVVFPYLVLARYGTPFVVVSHLGLGGAVFLAGRIAIGAVHETAHALVLASYGRRIARGGIKLVLIFPYFFVDTSDAWFERRRRRIAVSAAGPASDLTFAGVFSLASLALPPSPVRDVCFQLAFAAYLGGLFNLNPFLERDGYHILVDLLGEPRLRQRAQAQLRQVFAGQSPARSRVLMRYAVGGLIWSTAGSLFAVALSLRYRPALEALLPPGAVWAVLAASWLTFFTPVLILVVPAMRARNRRGIA
jgi:putative peptide zinc metalloprotease protein